MVLYFRKYEHVQGLCKPTSQPTEHDQNHTLPDSNTSHLKNLKIGRNAKRKGSSSNHPFSGANCYPNAPCREYLPTFPLECVHFSNVPTRSTWGGFREGNSALCLPSVFFRNLATIAVDIFMSADEQGTSSSAWARDCLAGGRRLKGNLERYCWWKRSGEHHLGKTANLNWLAGFFLLTIYSSTPPP